MEPIYGNVSHDPDKSQRSRSFTEMTSPERSYLRGAVVLLGLLSAGLLIGLIIVGANYPHSELSFCKANLTKLIANLLVKTQELEMLRDCWMLSNQTVPLGPCPPGWRRFGCSCYLLSNLTGSWEEGQMHCAAREATLVVVNGPAEQKFLSGFTTTSTFAWIGLTDRETEGTWKWINGAPLSQSNMYWRPGQPDNGGGHKTLGHENCAHVISGESKTDTWNDLQCNRSIAWFCEKSRVNAEYN